MYIQSTHRKFTQVIVNPSISQLNKYMRTKQYTILLQITQEITIGDNTDNLPSYECVAGRLADSGI